MPVVLMAYKVPVIRDVERDTDPYALEMFSAILDGHEAARFTKHLVREQRRRSSAVARSRTPVRKKTEAVEKLASGLLGCRGFYAVNLSQRHGDVLDGAQMLEEATLLEDEAELGAVGWQRRLVV